MAAKKKSAHGPSGPRRGRNTFSQGDWGPGDDTEELLDIMSRVSQAILSHRDLDLEPASVGKLAASVTDALYRKYLGLMADADFDDDAEDCVWELFLSTIQGVILYADAGDFHRKGGIGEIARTCVDNMKGLWSGFAELEHGTVDEDDDGEEDEEDEEDEDEDSLLSPRLQHRGEGHRVHAPRLPVRPWHGLPLYLGHRGPRHREALRARELPGDQEQERAPARPVNQLQVVTLVLLQAGHHESVRLAALDLHGDVTRGTAQEETLEVDRGLRLVDDLAPHVLRGGRYLPEPGCLLVGRHGGVLQEHVLRGSTDLMANDLTHRARLAAGSEKVSPLA